VQKWKLRGNDDSYCAKPEKQPFCTTSLCTTALCTITDTVNKTVMRTIGVGEILALDIIFNGNVDTSDLLSSFGCGTYRVYAAFRNPDGDVLIYDDEILMEAMYEFTIYYD